jgi:hypothetical protein
MSLLAIQLKCNQNPDPLNPERVGHPEKPNPERQNQFTGGDVLEWYHSTVRIRQEKKAEGCATRRALIAQSNGQW